jgi:hypothetical protein
MVISPIREICETCLPADRSGKSVSLERKKMLSDLPRFSQNKTKHLSKPAGRQAGPFNLRGKRLLSDLLRFSQKK